MKAIIHGDAASLWEDVSAWGYPTVHDAGVLQEGALMFRIHDRGETVAYVWATWHAFLPDTLDFHACADPEYRGRWLSSKVVEDLMKGAELVGARLVITKTVGDRAARLVAALLKRRFGFEQHEDGTVFRRID